jgi:hypothetical protein
LARSLFDQCTEQQKRTRSNALTSNQTDIKSGSGVKSHANAIQENFHQNNWSQFKLFYMVETQMNN